MFLDNSLLLADGVTTTTSAASTNVIDQLAKGDAVDGCWFLFSVPTAWTQVGTNTVKVELQTSNAEGFGGDSSDTTLVASGTLAIATLAAGYQWKVRIPVGAKRYLRGYVTVTGNSGANAITAAKYDMAIVKDVNIDRKLA